MSNIDKFLNQQNGFNNFASQQKDAFNGFDLEKQQYDAKKQALSSAKTISAQLLGQERLEAILAAPGIGKTVIGAARAGIRTATDPEFRSALRERATSEFQSQIDSLTGRARNAVGSARDAAEAQVGGVRDAAEGARDAAEGGVRDAVGGARDAVEGGVRNAERFRNTFDNRTPTGGDIEEERLTQGRDPFFGQGGPSRRTAEPGDIDYAAQQSRQASLEQVDQPISEVQSVGGFPRSGLPRPTASEPYNPTESEHMTRLKQQAEASPDARPRGQTAEASEAEAAETSTQNGSFLPDIEGLKTFKQRVSEGRSGLRQTTTAERSTSDVAQEASRFRGQLPESQARIPLSAEEASRAGYAPPSGTPPSTRGIINADSGSYTRPGTNLRIQSTRDPIPQYRPQQISGDEGIRAIRGAPSNIYPNLEGIEADGPKFIPTGGRFGLEQSDFPKIPEGRIEEAPSISTDQYGLPNLPRTGGQVPSTSTGTETPEAETRPAEERPEAPEASAPEERPEAPTERPPEASVPEEAESGTKLAVTDVAETEGATSALDAVPGIGELVMAGALIGGLLHARHEEREQQKRTPGPAPLPPTETTPTMAFDAAPTLDTSSYHSQ